MGTRKHSPIRFAELYAPLKAKQMSHRIIASKLKMSTSTLWAYLHDPKYVAQIDTKPIQAIQQIETKKMLTGHIDDLINLAAKLHKKMINEAIERENFELARKLSIDGLKVAKTQSQIQQILITIGNLSIRNKDEVNIELIQEQARADIWGKLCPVCQKKLMEARKK